MVGQVSPTIDPDSDVPVYRQVAAELRARIDSGVLRPHRPIPSEARLQQEFGVARDTIRRAVAYLADLGLVQTVSGRGTFVRAGADSITLVVADAETRIIARPARDTERARLGLDDGWWVVVVERPGKEPEVLPADKVEIRGA